VERILNPFHKSPLFGAHMAKKKTQPKPVVCAVCGKTLHSGTTFCVACGHQNQDTIAREMEINNQIERRLNAAHSFGWLSQAFRYLFRFGRH
jgi:ribosomal protein L37E